MPVPYHLLDETFPELEEEEKNGSRGECKVHVGERERGKESERVRGKEGERVRRKEGERMKG